MSLTPHQREHVNILTQRYLYLQRCITESGGTKYQRKEVDALKWILSFVTKTGAYTNPPINRAGDPSSNT